MSDEKDVHTESREREGELDGECDVSSEAAPEVRIPEFLCFPPFFASVVPI